MLPIIASCKGNRLELINNILEPYLAGVRARLDAIMPTYAIVHNFVSSINKFFSDKELSYSVLTGFKICIKSPEEGPQQELQPAQLSSGEQQLMLLFCHVLTARDKPSIFIIDEPEISLNILWQRMLIASLKEIAKGSDIQFFFASHSFEILAKHQKRVVSLEESDA